MTTRILAQFQRQHLAEQYAKHVANVLGETQAEPQSLGAERENPTMGNEQHARGVPILARGISGAISGTKPGERLDK
jgi:hypothetical protein